MSDHSTDDSTAQDPAAAGDRERGPGLWAPPVGEPAGRKTVVWVSVAAVVAVIVLLVTLFAVTREERVTDAELNLANVPSGELVFFATLKVNGVEQINRSVNGRYDADSGTLELLQYSDLTGAIRLPDGYTRYLWADGEFLVRPEAAWAPDGLGDRWLIEDSDPRIPKQPGLVGLTALRDAEPEVWGGVLESLRKEGSATVPITGDAAELYRGSLTWEQAVLLARTSMPFVSESFANLEVYIATSFPDLQGDELQAAVEQELADIPAYVEFWSIGGRPVGMRISIDPRGYAEGLLEFSVTAIMTRIGDVGTIDAPPADRRIRVSAFNDEINAARAAAEGRPGETSTETPSPTPSSTTTTVPGGN
jgi:hypothetical protein